MLKKIYVGRKVKIKKGSIIGQDFSFYKWNNNTIVFTIVSFLNDSKSRCFLAAPGYGLLGQTPSQYGNGKICVRIKDLISMK